MVWIILYTYIHNIYYIYLSMYGFFSLRRATVQYNDGDHNTNKYVRIYCRLRSGEYIIWSGADIIIIICININIIILLLTRVLHERRRGDDFFPRNLMSANAIILKTSNRYIYSYIINIYYLIRFCTRRRLACLHLCVYGRTSGSVYGKNPFLHIIILRDRCHGPRYLSRWSLGWFHSAYMYTTPPQ